MDKRYIHDGTQFDSSCLFSVATAAATAATTAPLVVVIANAAASTAAAARYFCTIDFAKLFLVVYVCIFSVPPASPWTGWWLVMVLYRRATGRDAIK